MTVRCKSRRRLRAWGLVVSGLALNGAVSRVAAEPIPLPYRSRGPFIPVIDLFGRPDQGLVLGAEEAIRGRPAPITIGNTTFLPAVRRAGQTYGGYTRITGDLQIRGGDLYLNDQSLNGSLLQIQNELTSQGQQVQVISSSHGQALRSLGADVGQMKQAIHRLEGHLNQLGSGVAGATALAAALTSLPRSSPEAPLTCGIGSGGYSSRYALAMGCAVRLNRAISLNAGGSYLFGGTSDYGNDSLSNVAGSVGLVYRFGSRPEDPQLANRQAIQEQLSQLQQRLNRLESLALTP